VVAAPKKLYAVHVDHLNRPIMLTDAAKLNVWWASYEPFGKVRATGGALTQNLGLPGQWFQLETGLAYNWHRHYDPTIGRYTTADPLGFVDGPSVYAYAGNRPHQDVDENGLQRGRRGPSATPGYDAFGRPQLDYSRSPLRFNGINPVIRGRQGEDSVRNSCTIGEPTRFEINGNRRISDGTTPSTLSEIKNRQYTPYTQQLRDSLDYSNSTGRSMDLYLPPGGRVSAPLQRAIDSGQINKRDIP
jgi:RHS repeat-associated protein